MHKEMTEPKNGTGHSQALDLTCTIHPLDSSYLDAIEQAVSNGDCLLLENIEESVDAVLDPLLGRLTIKKGKYIKIGDKEVEYHPKFRLILQTKLANPHYKPEMQAQATLINFTVTRDGLEDQLLAEVVATERPDLERTKVGVVYGGVVCGGVWGSEVFQP